MTVRYFLEAPAPHTHRVRVRMEVPPCVGPRVLAMASWTGGAYKLVDHARNVRGLSVTDADGESVPVERLDLHRWRVADAGAGLVITYEVFLDKLMIHQGQLDAGHLHACGQVLWLGVLEERRSPCTVTLQLPETWRVAWNLPHRGGEWHAADWDTLIEAPIEAGPWHEEASVEAGGVTWEVVHHDVLGPGHPGVSAMLPQLAATMGTLGLAAAEVFGELPFRRYQAIFHECEEPGFLNGLEHREAMTMQGPLGLDGDLEGFLTMVAHEVFHAWNGRRLSPRGLERGTDYWRPGHTRGLWVVEGCTEYYASLLMLRTGLMTPAAWSRQLGGLVSALEATPGRKITTLAESSFITWNFMDDRWNGAVNYYLKGALMAWALDMELRERSGDRVALDDLMRRLWQVHGDHRPWEPDEVECLACELVPGLETFFTEWLRTTRDPDWRVLARRAGLAHKIRKVPHVGLRLGREGRVASVEAGSPAEEAGVQRGDRLRLHDGGDVGAALAGLSAGRVWDIELERPRERVATRIHVREGVRHEFRPDPKADGETRRRFGMWQAGPKALGASPIS
ncbi:MAG: hypothetical protein VKO21_10765 [Candidatus Sericytochromatia bacterium]|nr:hypothetical protein [Candidatus Sericytochromatia bacterium]